MRITLTNSCVTFAEMHEGVAALKARVEHELEGLIERGLECAEDLFFHIFPWNGKDIIMGPQGDEMVVDVIDDDDGTLETSFGPTGGSEPDKVSIPHANEE